MPVAMPFAAVFGLLIGSFLNVVAYRLPRKESLAHPGSHCTSCEAAVKPYDNIPVFSWLLLRGRCRNCSQRISARYPLVEAGTAAIFAAVAIVHQHDAAELVMGIVLVAFLVPIALIDAEKQIIPNKLTYPALGVALALGLALDPAGEPERLIAFAIAGGILALPSLIHPSGMGMGDAKLVAVLGLFLGRNVAVAFAVAFTVGTIVGLVIMARKGMYAGRKTRVPFGPFLALGGVVAILAGHEITQAYLDTF